MAISTDRDKVRLLIGDTDVTDPLFQDDEIAYFLDVEGSVLGAAAGACEAAAARYARAYDFDTDEQSFKRSSMSGQYRAMATTFRARASGGGGNVAVTKVDGFSDDITATDVDVSAVNPRRRFYGAVDRLP